MFKLPSLAQIETMANLVSDKVCVKQMTPLSRAIYRELSLDEPTSIEELFKFYQGDKSHETIMDTLSTELATAITGLIGKVQNELLDVVDTTFEEVTKASKDTSAELITHRIHIVPEIKFLDSGVATEIAGRSVDNQVRLDIDRNVGGKFMERDAREILQRIGKTMGKDSFSLFVQMVNTLEVDIVEIYDVVIRGYNTKRKPLELIGKMMLPYTYVEALIGYHIATSLSEEPDLETRLTEVEYNNFVSAKTNNMIIRYKEAVKMITASLENTSRTSHFAIVNGVVELSVYEPVLVSLETEDHPRQKVIEILLSRVVTQLHGRIPGTTKAERYELYRREAVAKHRLTLSSGMITEIAKSFERFVSSLHFDTWWDANHDTAVTDNDRMTTLDSIRDRIRNCAIGSDDELYTLIIDVVCDVMYDRPGIKQFVGDIRVVMQDANVSPHEAVGIVSDRLVVKYLVDMLEK